MKFFGEELLLDEIRGIKLIVLLYSYLAIHSLQLLYRAVPRATLTKLEEKNEIRTRGSIIS